MGFNSVFKGLKWESVCKYVVLFYKPVSNNYVGWGLLKMPAKFGDCEG